MPRRLPALTWLGAALVGVGAAVLGHLAWQVWGTTVLAERDRDRVVAAVGRAWAERTGHPRNSGQPSSPPGLVADVVALVRIPRFGADYVVPVRRGTGDDVLARGFGWFEGSAGPAEPGNFALAGHRITHGEPLRHLPDLEPGDRVVVRTENAEYVYVLDTPGDGLRIPLDRTWVLDEHPGNPAGGPEPPASAGNRLLTLVTCAELFHTDDRLVVFGHLLRSR